MNSGNTTLMKKTHFFCRLLGSQRFMAHNWVGSSRSSGGAGGGNISSPPPKKTTTYTLENSHLEPKNHPIEIRNIIWTNPPFFWVPCVSSVVDIHLNIPKGSPTLHDLKHILNFRVFQSQAAPLSKNSNKLSKSWYLSSQRKWSVDGCLDSLFGSMWDFFHGFLVYDCTRWWFFTNPSEKYAQVKLDHFPKLGWNLNIFQLPPPRKMLDAHPSHPLIDVHVPS